MKIDILHLIEGAKRARGLTVIIDVFRAFSLACYMVDKGALKIIPVGDINAAYRLKEKHPDYILVGERNNKKMPGFDFGNSPHEIRNFNFKGKTVVHTTSAGTQGIVNASESDEIITGSFVNAGAIVRYIQKQQPDVVSLICMGYSANYPIEEDTYCAEYIKNLLEGNSSDFTKMVEHIKNTSGKRFFDIDMQEHCPSEDFYLCLDLNRFNFVLKASRDDKGLFYLTKVE